jgi:hypothetical protein
MILINLSCINLSCSYQSPTCDRSSSASCHTTSHIPWTLSHILYLSLLYFDSCGVFRWMVMGRKPVNFTPPVGSEAIRLSHLTGWVIIHLETPRSYTTFCFYPLEILSVLVLDLYKLQDILDKQNGYVEYKETDRTWQLVYNLAKIRWWNNALGCGHVI